MRNLIKKSLAFCLVAALALSCFVGALTVSAETYTATVTVSNNQINRGTTSVDVFITIDCDTDVTGINEALINVSSGLGTIASAATLVSIDGVEVADPETAAASIEYAGNATDYSTFYLSVKNVSDGNTTTLATIDNAVIKVTFAVDANKAPADYYINVNAEDIVDAASPKEDIIDFNCTAGKVTIVCLHTEKNYENLDDTNHKVTCGICNEIIAETEAHTFTDGADCVCGQPAPAVEPECDHAEKIYTDNNDGATHTITCANAECNEVIDNDAPHVDTDTNNVCDDCEAILVYEDEDLKIRSASLLLANGFDINYKVKKTMETTSGYSDIYITFTKPRYDKDGNVVENRVVTVTASQRTEETENYVYTLKGVQPQEIGTVITATIYGTKDGHVYTGGTVEYSVVKYATSQMSKPLSDTITSELKTACADLIVYGSEVQKYASYNTANPIIDYANELYGNATWKEEFSTKDISRALENVKASTPLDGQTVKIKSANIILDSKVVMQFVSSNNDGTTLTNSDNYEIYATYKTFAGEDRTLNLAIGSDGKAQLDTLYSTELGAVVTAYMIEKSTGNIVSNTVVYSIESYIDKNKNDAIEGGWSTALLKYGDSVVAFAG